MGRRGPRRKNGHQRLVARNPATHPGWAPCSCCGLGGSVAPASVLGLCSACLRLMVRIFGGR